MTVELRPLGVRCNLQCQYCYQNPQRDVEDPARSYDMDKMKDAIRAQGGPFSLFGDEPLMMPLADLEQLWSWGLAEYGSNSVQTNGVLISDAHLELFRKYNVRVGISLDGPGALNDARWHQTVKKTRESTDRVQAQIERLCRSGTPPSLIITLHRHNAATDELPHLLNWVRELVGLGVLGASRAWSAVILPATPSVILTPLPARIRLAGNTFFGRPGRCARQARACRYPSRQRACLLPGPAARRRSIWSA